VRFSKTTKARPLLELVLCGFSRRWWNLAV
jgi:hypothetical protein